MSHAADNVAYVELRTFDVHPVARLDQRVVMSAPNDVIKLLADPLRAQMVKDLANGPARTCHLVENLRASQSNVSNHLRVLREAGVVERVPRGRYTFYRLRPDMLADAAGQLSALAERARSTVDVSRPVC